MVFVFQKISDVENPSPIVARLGIQTADLVKWLEVPEETRDAIRKLYFFTLPQKLIHCRGLRNNIIEKMNEYISSVKLEGSNQSAQLPYIQGLDNFCHNFLYEFKNYVRDVISIINLVFGTKFIDGSDIVDLRKGGKSKVEIWAENNFGPDDHLTKMLSKEAEWAAEFIKARNAVEHPGGYSGTLTVTNVRRITAMGGAIVPPTWQRTGRPETDVLADMEVTLDNMLTFAEDLLAELVLKKPTSKGIEIYLIAEKERDPICPIRLKVGPNREILEKIEQMQQYAGKPG
ncbi:hypothetical protein [Bosea sp. BIWAKO-01]|uniref:hypothetical protein n=1 Tax=Bosea sp. BIWAKO-01 TaxID=506668 RepID=UPI00114C8C38|nr:hypothetical protein [Bosea sp. BIWAKO-01]